MIGVLLGLFAFTCLSSMTAMDVSAALLSLAVLYKSFQWKKRNEPYRLFNWTGFDWIFVLWIAVVALGFVFSPNEAPNWVKRLVEFKWVLIWYALTSAIIYVKPKQKIIFWIGIIAALACAIAVFFSFLSYDPIKNEPALKMYGSIFVRTGGLYGNAMVFAHCYGILFCFLFAWMCFVRQWTKKEVWALSAAFVLCGMALALTFTRGVWISVFAASLVMLFCVNLKIATIAAIAGLVPVAGLYLIWGNIKRVGDQVRVILWQTNWEIFIDHPLVGVGYGENLRLLPEYFAKLGFTDESLLLFSHAHNQILHLLAGTGALGALAFLVFYFSFVILSLNVWKAIPQTNYWHKAIALGAIGSQVHFFIGGFFESNFEHAKMKYVMMFVWGSVVWLAYEYKLLTWSRKQKA